MSLGPLTYKTPNPITYIDSDLTNSEGCGLVLSAQYTVGLATTESDIPYGVVVVGAASVDGTYTGVIAAGALEVVDAFGAVAQVKASSAGSIAAGTTVYIDANDANGTFKSAAGAASGEWTWGLALTDCAAGEQFLFRFQPAIVP